MFGEYLKKLSLAMLIVNAWCAYSMDIFEAVEKGDVELVARVLRTNPEAIRDTMDDYLFFTALHIAVRRGHVPVARLLLSRGSDVNARGANNITPLHEAARSRAPQAQMITLLVDNGADIDAQDAHGWSPLSLALAGQSEWFFDRVKILVALGAEVNQKQKFSKTPLHFAAVNGNYDIVSFLVQHGADVNAYVHRYSYNNFASYPLAGISVLSKAVTEGHFEIAQFLIRHGAEVDTSIESALRTLRPDYDWRTDQAAFQQAWIAGFREHFGLPDDIAELILVVAGIMPLRASETIECSPPPHAGQ